MTALIGTRLVYAACVPGRLKRSTFAGHIQYMKPLEDDRCLSRCSDCRLLVLKYTSLVYISTLDAVKCWNLLVSENVLEGVVVRNIVVFWVLNRYG